MRVFLAGNKLSTCTKKTRLRELPNASCATAYLGLHLPCSELLSETWTTSSEMQLGSYPRIIGYPRALPRDSCRQQDTSREHDRRKTMRANWCTVEFIGRGPEYTAGRQCPASLHKNVSHVCGMTIYLR